MGGRPRQLLLYLEMLWQFPFFSSAIDDFFYSQPGIFMSYLQFSKTRVIVVSFCLLDIPFKNCVVCFLNLFCQFGVHVYLQLFV